MSEQSEVQWGGTNIPYVIRRSERRATVGIAVEPSGTVVLTAPKAATIPRLDSVVLQKAKWIMDRVKERAALPQPRAREFVSGETFLYLGDPYRLRVIRTDVGQSIGQRIVHLVALRDRWLELTVPANLDGEAAATHARTTLIDWYKSCAREHFAAWVAPWAEAVGVEMPKLLVADQEKRWGSCTKGTLRINWRILQAPRTLVDYVLAHEVVHLVHDHHGAEFWAALGRIQPDYEARKVRLRTLGPELTW